jgi:hypothetical protein
LTLAGPDEMAAEAQALAARRYRHWQLKIGEDSVRIQKPTLNGSDLLWRP